MNMGTAVPHNSLNASPQSKYGSITKQKEYMFKTKQKQGRGSSNLHTYSQLNKQSQGKKGNTLWRIQKLCCEVVVIHQRRTFQQA